MKKNRKYALISFSETKEQFPENDHRQRTIVSCILLCK